MLPAPVSEERWNRSFIALAGQFVFFWIVPRLFDKEHPFRKITAHTFLGALGITAFSCGIEWYHQSVRHEAGKKTFDWDFARNPRRWDPFPMAVFTLQGYSTGIGSNLANGSRPYTMISRWLCGNSRPIIFGRPIDNFRSYLGRTFALNLLVSGFWCFFFVPYALAEDKPLKDQLKYIASSMLAQFSLGWCRRMLAWRVSVPSTGPYYGVNDGLFVVQQGLMATIFGSH